MNRRWLLAAGAGIVALALVVLVAFVTRADTPGSDVKAARPHAATGSTSPSPAAVPSRRPDPSALAGQRFYVDPRSHAEVAEQLLQAAGQQVLATRVERIAKQPAAVWFTGEPGSAASALSLSRAAAAEGRTLVAAIYDIPHRDCGSYSAGGAPAAADYLAYVRQVASGLRGSAVVILEPDAIPLALGDCPGVDADARFALLRQAVAILRTRPAVKTYLDAGHSDWISDTSALVRALRASGVERAAGFALNVANYQTTAASAGYGERIGTLLGGKHFVIDTSRNGAGPYDASGASVQAEWCNPPGREIGAAPTTDTGIAGVDAFLWVKQPGDSDGTCGPGQPPAGSWWLERALALAG